MTTARKTGRTRAATLFVAALLAPAPALAQVTPAQGYTPPDDTPSIRVGTTIFLDYTLQQSPDVKDAAGRNVNFNAFQVGRTYINVTGQVHHRLSFRITPDIRQETGTGSSLNGSLTFRLKYAYAQVNLDDWLTGGSWVRIGMQQTPMIDYQEGVYRYRFQGTVFADREGFLSSSDSGVSFRTQFKNNYGDVHAGIYNGETFSKLEANDQKAFMVRATFRPMPRARTLRGLRVSGFYDADAAVKDGRRRRALGDLTFEHRFVNTGFIYLATSDQALPASARIDGRGFSIWATPRTTKGWEGLLRFDRLEPNTGDDDRKNRAMAGVAYWLPISGAQAAFLLDFEKVDYRNYAPARPKEQRVALHMLLNF
ncbi:MAG: hypothetical protein HYU53_11975 [Acidobacteria bacterium]|nr:hypothetical protein [Acidobacteriota bacterium]